MLHLILLQNSVNARYQTIPYPWLVFGEKVKVNTVFIRDSTSVSDSILILFGGALAHGVSVCSCLSFLFFSVVNWTLVKNKEERKDWIIRWYRRQKELIEILFLQKGHLKMLDGYIDFFMDPSLAECYWNLKEELDTLIQKKVSQNSLAKKPHLNEPSVNIKLSFSTKLSSSSKSFIIPNILFG